MTYCMVIITCAERDEAEKLANTLINKKLAACVQLNKITSYCRNSHTKWITRISCLD